MKSVTHPKSLLIPGRQAEVDHLASGWFQPFYRLHHAAVRGVVFRFGIQNDLEDVIQEVFLKAFKARKDFLHNSSDRTWIIRIAVNSAKDFLRRHQNDNKQTDTDVETLAIASNAQDNLLSPSPMSLINQGVGRLTEPLRAALVLNVLEGYSIVETATILDIPEGTVKSRVSAAREQLKQFLAGKGIKP